MGWLTQDIRRLHPACFAMVMATGIVSIAASLHGMHRIAIFLTVINPVIYGVLLVLTLLRLVFHWDAVRNDLLDHSRCVGYFTIVAATCVLGSQCHLILESTPIAAILWGTGILLWLMLNYTIFTILTVKEHKPPLAEGINGGWLVAVVATQSVANLGELVLQQLHPYDEWVHLFSLSLWLSGGMLYIWIISLIFYRYTFYKFSPSDLMPPYWINMGAMAISTLAGATLIRNSADSALLLSLLPFLKGFTLLFWATATWWIPMLAILWIWRHVYRRYPLHYDPLYWGAVFPLGMYTVCTYRLAQALELPILFSIPAAFVFISQIVWLVTALSFLHDRYIRVRNALHEQVSGSSACGP